MTTDNIVYDDGQDEIGADELVAELGRLGAAAKRRARTVNEELEGIDRKRENARLGARVVERKLIDDGEVLAEEADQLAWILGTPDETEAPEPPIPPVGPLTPPPAPPWVPPVPPTPPVDDEPDDTIVPPPADDGDDEPDAPVQVNVFITFVHWVRAWTPIAWLFAILGAIIALLVANATKGTFDDIVGFGRGVIVTLWFVFVTCLGFCLGGLLGSLLNRGNTE